MFSFRLHSEVDPHCELMYLLVFRLAYAVWLLNQISQRQPGEINILVMYDIACTLVRHLKVCTECI